MIIKNSITKTIIKVYIADAAISHDLFYYSPMAIKWIKLIDYFLKKKFTIFLI